MVPARVLRLLLVALTASSAAQALDLQPFRIGVPMNALSKREPLPQATNDNSAQTDSATNSPSSTPSSTPTSPSSTPSETPSSTPSQTPTSPTDEPTSPSATPTPSKTPTDTSDQPNNTGDSGNNDTSESVTTMTTVYTITRDNGQLETKTDVTTSTGTASLAEGGSTSGMSTSTRNTIIGVVVGVGGAIVLCGIGFAAWRIRSRKRNAEENDGLIGYGGYTAGAAEKPDSLTGPASGSTGGRTPFQSTLESYHAPTQVNQASNF